MYSGEDKLMTSTKECTGGSKSAHASQGRSNGLGFSNRHEWFTFHFAMRMAPNQDALFELTKRLDALRNHSLADIEFSNAQRAISDMSEILEAEQHYWEPGPKIRVSKFATAANQRYRAHH